MRRMGTCAKYDEKTSLKTIVYQAGTHPKRQTDRQIGKQIGRQDRTRQDRQIYNLLHENEHCIKDQTFCRLHGAQDGMVVLKYRNTHHVIPAVRPFYSSLADLGGSGHGPKSSLAIDFDPPPTKKYT